MASSIPIASLSVLLLSWLLQSPDVIHWLMKMRSAARFNPILAFGYIGLWIATTGGWIVCIPLVQAPSSDTRTLRIFLAMGAPLTVLVEVGLSNRTFPSADLGRPS